MEGFVLALASWPDFPLPVTLALAGTPWRATALRLLLHGCCLRLTLLQVVMHSATPGCELGVGGPPSQSALLRCIMLLECNIATGTDKIMPL